MNYEKFKAAAKSAKELSVYFESDSVADKDDVLQPLAAVINKDNEVTLLAMPQGFTDSASKAAYINFIEANATEQDAKSIMFCVDTYIANYKVDKDGEPPIIDCLPSENPERMEALAVSIITEEKIVVTKMIYKIVDDEFMWVEDQVFDSSNGGHVSSSVFPDIWRDKR